MAATLGVPLESLYSHLPETLGQSLTVGLTINLKSTKRKNLVAGPEYFALNIDQTNWFLMSLQSFSFTKFTLKTCYTIHRHNLNFS